MADPKLEVIAGSLPRRSSGKTAKVRDAMAKRWRIDSLFTTAPRLESVESRDVIPLLDGWIRRLEREAGDDQQQPR
jgi:hypothetical protein